MYRLKVKVNSRKWKLGINVYKSIEDAEARKKEMEAVGHKVKIVETDF